MASQKLIFGLTLASLVLSVSCQFGPIEFGENCGGFDICNSADKTNPLDCTDPNEGTCVCISGTILDEVENRCLAPVGQNCTFCTSNDDLFYFHTCGGFAQCDMIESRYTCEEIKQAPWPMKNDGSCSCKAGATRDEIGFCRLPYGSENCEKPSDCDTLGLQTCSGEGKCICQGRREYDESTGKCVGDGDEATEPGSGTDATTSSSKVTEPNGSEPTTQSDEGTTASEANPGPGDGNTTQGSSSVLVPNLVGCLYVVMISFVMKN